MLSGKRTIMIRENRIFCDPVGGAFFLLDFPVMMIFIFD